MEKELKDLSEILLDTLKEERQKKVAEYQTKEGKEKLKPASLAFELNRILASDEKSLSNQLDSKFLIENCLEEDDDIRTLVSFTTSLNNVANAINKQTEVLIASYTDDDPLLSEALKKASKAMIPLPSPVVGFGVESRTEAYRNITMGMRQLLYYTQINNKIMEFLIEPLYS